MTQTNFLFPQTIISQLGWTNINAVLVHDNTYASSTPINGTESEFTVGNFLFNIPSNSLISGIEIEVSGYIGATALPSTTLEIWAYDNTNSNNAWYQMTPVFTGFNTSSQTYILGSQSYTFNQNLTADQVNNMKFKFMVNGEVYLDSVRVRVSYNEPAISVITSSNVCTSILQAQPFFLLQPVGPTDTILNVNRFKTSDGVDINTSDLPVAGYPATVDPLTPTEENIKILAVIPLSGDTRQLVVSRGWSFRDPDGQSPILAKSHGLSEIVLSNNFQYENDKIRTCQIGALVSEPISVYDDSAFVAKPVSSFNFIGSGVSVTQISDPSSLYGGKQAIVTINGFNPSLPSGNGGSSGTSGNTQVTNLNYQTHNVTGTDRYTIVSIATENTTTVSNVTIGGNPLVFLGTHTQADVRLELWGLVNTPLGVNIVNITLTTPAYVSSSQYTWNNVDQTTSFTFGAGNGNNTNISTGTGTTTSINSLLIHATGTHEPSIVYTNGSGESIVASTLSGQYQTAIEYQNVGTPSIQTSNINLSIITDWSNLIGVLNPTPVSVPVSGQTSIQFKDEGTNLGSTGTVDIVNFTGTGVTASRVGNTVTVNVPSTGGTGTGTQSAPITQPSHGFTIGYPTPIRMDSSGVYVKSLAVKTSSSDLSAEVIGIAIATTVNDFTIYYNGQIPTPTTPFSALAQGTPLYVSATTAGILTDIEPTGTTNVSKPIGYVDIATGAGARIVLQNMRGLVEDSGGGSTGVSSSFMFNGVTAQNYNFGGGNFVQSPLRYIEQRGDDITAEYITDGSIIYKKNTFGFYKNTGIPCETTNFVGGLATSAILNNSTAAIQLVSTSGSSPNQVVTIKINFRDLITGSLLGSSSNITLSTLFGGSPGGYSIIHYTSIGNRIYALIENFGFGASGGQLMLVIDTNGTNSATLVSENVITTLSLSDGFDGILKTTTNNNFLFKVNNTVYDYTTGAVIQTLNTSDITNFTNWNPPTGPTGGYIRYNNNTYSYFNIIQGSIVAAGAQYAVCQSFEFDIIPNI